ESVMSATHFRRRSDQRADLLLRPSIEPRDGIQREASCEPKGRPVRTYASKFCERFRGAGNVVRVRHVLGGILPSKVALIERCLVGVHYRLGIITDQSPCEVNGASRNPR